VKLLDFGLAKIGTHGPFGDLPATMTRPLTEAGSILGTLQYMSPEQLEGKEADARSDIFSFGCLLYEILTGQRAFRADSQATLIAAIIDREPEPMISLQPMIPPTLDRLVKKCLAKDADARWQTAADLRSELEWVLESGSNAAMPAPIVAARRRNARLGWITAAALAVLAAATAGYALTLGRRVPAPVRAIRFNVQPPDGVTWGSGDQPFISPDGARIVFPGQRPDGVRMLWMRSLDALEPQPLPGTEGVSFGVTWSPDSRAIAFAANGMLKKLELGAAAPQQLTSVSAWGPPAWNDGGVILFSQDVQPYVLAQVSASGGEVKPVTSLSTTGSAPFHGVPSFLPDGRGFVFFAGSNIAGTAYRGSLDSTATQRLPIATSALFAPPGWLVYNRDSSIVAQAFNPSTAELSGETVTVAQAALPGPEGTGFSISRTGVLAYRTAVETPMSELTWFDREGKRLGTLGDPALYTNPSLSPDGRRLAVGRLDPTAGTRDIWIFDVARGSGSRFTFDKADDLNPIWSPDGARIAFTSDRKGRRDLYWRAADGMGGDELVLHTEEQKSLEDWSPDGMTLLFNVDSAAVFAVPLAGERKPVPVLQSSFVQMQGRVSPDGRWIAYVSAESPRQEVFVQAFPPTGGKFQISTRGGTEPFWRRDGKELFFMCGTKLCAADITATGSSFDVGASRELFDMPRVTDAQRRNRYLPTGDGQRFLFVTTPQGADRTPFTVILNWSAALPR